MGTIDFIISLLNNDTLSTPLEKMTIGALFGLLGGLIKAHTNKQKSLFPKFFFIEPDPLTGVEKLEKTNLFSAFIFSSKKKIFIKSGKIPEILMSPIFGAVSVFLLPITGETTVVAGTGIVFGFAGTNLIEKIILDKIKKINMEIEEAFEKIDFEYFEETEKKNKE